MKKRKWHGMTRKMRKKADAAHVESQMPVEVLNQLVTVQTEPATALMDPAKALTHLPAAPMEKLRAIQENQHHLQNHHRAATDQPAAKVLRHPKAAPADANRAAALQRKAAPGVNLLPVKEAAQELNRDKSIIRKAIGSSAYWCAQWPLYLCDAGFYFRHGWDRYR